MEDEVAAVDKPMVYLDEKADRWVYRASALMSCQNALLCARNGVTGYMPPEWLQERFDEGHEQEALILAKLDANYGFNCYAHQQEVELSVGTGAMIRGHIDALSLLDEAVFTSVDCVEVDKFFTVGTGLIGVVDSKALAPGGATKWAKEFFEGYLHYLWQQATYLYAGDWDVIVMAVKDKVTGKIRRDAFTKKWILERLPKATLIQRVMWVESQHKKGVLFDDVCSPVMFPCPFFNMHPAKEVTENEPTAFEGEVAELKRMGDMVMVLDASIKAQQAELEIAKQNIANHIGNKAMAAQKLGTCSVSAYHSTGTQTLWKELTEALNEKSVDKVKKQFTRKTTSEKLTIKVVAT